MALLSILRDAASEIGIARPTDGVDSTDLQVQQLVRCAQAEGKELARRFDWQRLIKEATFTTVDTALQITLAAVAADFGRYLNETMWNRSTSWPVQGPLNSLEWQQRQAAGTQAGMGNWFRIFGGAIYFYPTPTTEDTIYFEYVSKNWCQSAAAVAQSSWAADTDTSLLDEELMTLGVIWRFLKTKGLEYGESFATYERALEAIFGPDGGRPVVDMTGTMGDYLTLTIPEGSWNQ